MNRIVRENYPVADLPKDLREGMGVDEMARVVIETKRKAVRASKDGFDLQTLYTKFKPAFGNRGEITQHIDTIRGEWDDR